MKYDVIALGELLIDFTQYGVSNQGNLTFEANPGGAPGNVLSMLGRLGRRTAFIGKVGNDRFGHILADALSEQGIDASYLVFDSDIPTTLALVHRLPDGDRDFSFYRSPGADMMLRPDEVDEALFERARVFHFGTLSLTDEPVALATKRAAELAKKHGLLVSFDPNLRPPLWKDLNAAKAAFEYGFGVCDILKISDNELQWYTGLDDIDAGAAELRRRFDIPLILVSLGADGSCAYKKDVKVSMPAFIYDEVADTTGAGDTFCACCIDAVLKNGIDMDKEQLAYMLRFANAAASLVTLKKGALRVMPSIEEVQKLM